jgi:hypothetical protein
LDLRRDVDGAVVVVVALAEPAAEGFGRFALEGDSGPMG